MNRVVSLGYTPVYSVFVVCKELLDKGFTLIEYFKTRNSEKKNEEIKTSA
jgi:hypothetical protein